MEMEQEELKKIEIKQKKVEKKIKGISEKSAREKIKSSNSCIYLEDLIFKKNIELEKEKRSCYICGKPAIYYADITADDFKIKEDMRMFACANHATKKLKYCKNPRIPFIIAPCNYLAKQSDCSAYSLTIISLTKDDAELFPRPPDKNCLHLGLCEKKPIKTQEKCYFCNEIASTEIQLNSTKTNLLKRIVNCNLHAKFNYQCNCELISMFPAPCLFFETMSNCIFFNFQY